MRLSIPKCRRWVWLSRQYQGRQDLIISYIHQTDHRMTSSYLQVLKWNIRYFYRLDLIAENISVCAETRNYHFFPPMWVVWAGMSLHLHRESSDKVTMQGRSSYMYPIPTLHLFRHITRKAHAQKLIARVSSFIPRNCHKPGFDKSHEHILSKYPPPTSNSTARR